MPTTKLKDKTATTMTTRCEDNLSVYLRGGKARRESNDDDDEDDEASSRDVKVRKGVVKNVESRATRTTTTTTKVSDKKVYFSTPSKDKSRQQG